MNRRIIGALLCAWASSASPAFADVAACLNDAERAQPLRAEGQLIEARKALIACSSPACPAVVVNDCTRWLTDVEEALPSLVFQVRGPAGDDVLDARVFVDGALYRQAADGSPVSVDPGIRHLRFERQGLVTVEQAVVVRQGEHRRVITAVLSPPPPPAAPSASALAAPAIRVAADRPLLPVSAWVLGGAGVALAATGIGLWVDGTHDHTVLARSCAPSATCAHDDVVAARRKLVAGDVLFGSAVLAMGGAVLLSVTVHRARATFAIAPLSVVARGEF